MRIKRITMLDRPNLTPGIQKPGMKLSAMPIPMAKAKKMANKDRRRTLME